MALRIHRLRPRADHFLVRARFSGNAGELVGQRAPGDRHALSMQHTVVEQDAQDLRHAARGVEIGGDETSRRLELAQHRHALAHALEVVDRPLDAGGSGDRKIVQHRVGRAARRHHQRDRVFDRVACDDIARLQLALDGVDQSPS